MKNFPILITLLLFTACGPIEKESLSIQGEWKDVNGNAFEHCTANFYQVGDSIFFNHFLTWNGKPFFEKGSGIIKGDSVLYQVDVLYGIEGWSTAGDHALKLSADGNTLEGSYKDNTGNSGPLKFKRVR